MYILDKNEVRTNSLWMLGFSLFCALFGGIYEIFSHEVYSFYMMYAFAIPLVGGTTIYLLMERFGKKMPDRKSVSYWNMAIVTLTVGSLYRGVIDIYGTTNKKIWIYVIAAAVLGVAAVIKYFRIKPEPDDSQEDVFVES